MTALPKAVLAAADRFVIPQIEGDRDFGGEHAPADVVGLGLSLGDWARPEEGWSPLPTVHHFRELFPRRKPRPLTADRCARVILLGFDDEILHADMYAITEIELLLALAPHCGPTNRLRLIQFVEAWVGAAPDEAFEDSAEGWATSWQTLTGDMRLAGRSAADAMRDLAASMSALRIRR